MRKLRQPLEIKIGTPESLERFANSPVKLTAPGSGQPLVQRLLDQGMGEGVALDSFPENVSGYRLIEEVQERVLVAPCDCRTFGRERSRPSTDE